MNFVFVSPQFPASYWNFCDRLKQRGVTVLGLSDAPYDSLSDQVKNSLTEYYRVDNMEDYDQMVRAMGYFTHKYGKIDWLESNNEFQYYNRYEERAGCQCQEKICHEGIL